MNNTMDPSSFPVDVEAFIQGTSETYSYLLSSVGGLSLLLYTTLLGFSQEVEYVWLKKFSLPNLLYIFARYGSLVAEALFVGFDFLPLGKACDKVANSASVITFLALAGVQGSLITRAYALCQESKIVTRLLALVFFSQLVLYLINIIKFPGCSLHFSNAAKTFESLSNGCGIVADLMVFGVCWWNVWGTWKLKRKTAVRSSHDLVSTFLTQIISRFCFVITGTLAVTVFNVAVPSGKLGWLVESLTKFQQVLSTILLTSFTLDLRQRNSASIAASNISLPTLDFGSVLSHIHQSIIAEMGDHCQHITAEPGAENHGSENASNGIGDQEQAADSTEAVDRDTSSSV